MSKSENTLLVIPIKRIQRAAITKTAENTPHFSAYSMLSVCLYTTKNGMIRKTKKGLQKKEINRASAFMKLSFEGKKVLYLSQKPQAHRQEAVHILYR